MSMPFSVIDDGTILELPELDAASLGSNRRITFRAGEVNTFVHTDPDGNDHEGYFTFASVRVIRVAARVQVAKRGKMLVINQSMIADGPEIGLIVDGQQVPHPLFTEPRYAAWMDSDRPKRINAQQWVLPANRDKVLAYAEALQAEFGFRVNTRPANRSQQRQTEDLFVAQPVRPLDRSNPTTHGVKVDAFEVTSNPTYEVGFTDFLSGLEDQRTRWERALNMEGSDRETYLREISRNAHYLGGVYHDDVQKTWWARPTDVSSVTLGGTEFPLYSVAGDTLTEDLFSVLDVEDAPAGATGEVAAATDPVLASVQESLRAKVLETQRALDAEASAS